MPTDQAVGPRYAEVVVDQLSAGLDRIFTYSIPGRLAERVGIGSYVRIPLGRQRLAGYVVELPEQQPDFPLRDIEDLLLDEPMFGPEELSLARRVAQTYYCPLSSALRLILPPGAARRPEQLILITEAGQTALAGEDLLRAPKQEALLKALACVGGQATREELEKVPELAAGLSSLLQRLEEKGFVQVQHCLQRPGASPRRQQWVRLQVTPGQARQQAEALAPRAAQQAQILLRLAEEGPLKLADLARSSVPGLATRGLVKIYEQLVRRRPAAPTLNLASPRWPPTAAQQRALQRVQQALEAHTYWGGLLHGVTGSGKTEVYLDSIEMTRQRGRSAIVLVPEISLTPQTVERFAARFGEEIAVLHSSLSLGERYDEWQRVKQGQARVVIGARSAVFAPCASLGMVIVDEEHEPSYKQDSSPRYQAVTVARWRAQQAGAVLLLGSATPALEHYWAAANPDDPSLELLELPERIGNRPLPVVRTLDLRTETVLGPGRTFAEEMETAIRERLERSEQVMVFLNRRGFSTFVMCRECGYVLRCPHCAVSLIYHRQSQTMRCHHCDYARPVPDQCDNCQGYDIGFHGLGTERINDQVSRQFPEARVLRLDRDTVKRRGAYSRILGQFARGEADILIGTQMIAKGHDFPEVTLVGVINADVGLHRPDFRAAERTFQLLTQVSGRAGRADKPGEVFVQTYNPEHYALQAAAEHDYREFFAIEIKARQENLYPPFTKLANLVFSHPDQQIALATARRAAIFFQEHGWQHGRGPVQFVGPGACPLHKLRGRYRYQILLKAPKYEILNEIIRQFQAHEELPADLRLTVDVDPYDMM